MTTARALARRVVPLAVRQRRAALPAWSLAVCTASDPLALATATPEPVFDRGAVPGVMADPFAVRRDGLWSLFFELVPPGERRGRIAVAASADGRRWTYGGVVLEERWHLSYPFVLEAGPDVFLVPESADARSVRLYRAHRFPCTWESDAVLLTGRPFRDSSVFTYGGHWWLLTETSARATNDELRLYMAEDLRGPWREHPRSPVCRDARYARPAGRPVVVEDRLVRFAQDCSGEYGAAVHAVQITTLTEDDYEERLLRPRVLPSATSSTWPARAVHHVDAHRLDSCPDGKHHGGPRWLCVLDGHP